VLVLLAVVACAAAASAKPRGVTLDVKDADVHDILKSMQQQCGVKNLLIDKDVAGAGTIYFKDVACETAFRVVFQQFGLAGTYEGNVVSVEARKK
jgi:type II secretory pathway component GspD/PulD (secretin)